MKVKLTFILVFVYLLLITSVPAAIIVNPGKGGGNTNIYSSFINSVDSSFFYVTNGELRFVPFPPPPPGMDGTNIVIINTEIVTNITVIDTFTGSNFIAFNTLINDATFTGTVVYSGPTTVTTTNFNTTNFFFNNQYITNITQGIGPNNTSCSDTNAPWPTPFAYYNLQFLTNTTDAFDSIGGRTLFGSTGTTLTNGVQSNAFSFLGTGFGSALIRSDQAFNFTNHSFTIRFWTKPVALDSLFHSLLDRKSGGNGWQCYVDSDNKVKVDYTIGFASTTLVMGIPNVNEWNRIIFSYDNTNHVVIAQLNNDAIDSSVFTGIGNTSKGIELTSSTYWYQFDEIGIWKDYVWSTNDMAFDWKCGCGMTYPTNDAVECVFPNYTFNYPTIFNEAIYVGGNLLTNLGNSNPTIGFIPYNKDGTNFGDSPWYRQGATEARLKVANTATFEGTNFAGATKIMTIQGALGGSGGGVIADEVDLLFQAAGSVILESTPYRAYLYQTAFQPGTSNEVDLGTSLLPWKSLYLGSNSLHFIFAGNDVAYSDNGTVLTRNGVPVGGGGSSADKQFGASSLTNLSILTPSHTNALWVSTDGDDSTGVINNPLLPVLTITNAIVKAAAGNIDIIILSGTYDIGTNQIIVPANVSLRGVGNPIITCSVDLVDVGPSFVPGDNTVIEGIEFTCPVKDSQFQAFIGSYSNGGFTNAVVRNNHFIGGSDVFYLHTVANFKELIVYHNIIETDWDSWACFETNNRAKIFDNTFIAHGPPALDSVQECHAIFLQGEAEITGNLFVVSGPNANNVGVLMSAFADQANVFLCGNRFEVSGPSASAYIYNAPTVLTVCDSFSGGSGFGFPANLNVLWPSTNQVGVLTNNAVGEMGWMPLGGGSSLWTDFVSFIAPSGFTNGLQIESLSSGFGSGINMGKEHELWNSYPGSHLFIFKNLQDPAISGAGLVFDMAATATNDFHKAWEIFGIVDTNKTELDFYAENNLVTKFEPTASDGTTPYILDTSLLHTSGNLVEVKNNGALKASLDFAGSTLQDGGISTGLQTITDHDYSVSWQDSVLILYSDVATNNTFTLPNPATFGSETHGKVLQFYLWKDGSGHLVLDTGGFGHIRPQNSITMDLTTNGQTVTLIANDQDWFIIQ